MDFKEQLIREKEAILKRLELIEEYLKTFDESNGFSNSITTKKDKKFPVKGTKIEQIAYVIKKENRFLHNSEITDVLIQYWKKDRKDVKRRVSAVLSLAKREGTGNLTSIKVGKSLKNTFWGSSNWLDGEGNPKPEHKYDENLVEVAGSKEIII